MFSAFHSTYSFFAESESNMNLLHFLCRTACALQAPDASVRRDFDADDISIFVGKCIKLCELLVELEGRIS